MTAGAATAAPPGAAPGSRPGPPGAKRRALLVLVVAQVAAMSAWFATTASLAAIRAGWSLTPFQEALLTSSVQAGFVAGTLLSALMSLPDRVDLRTLFAASAALAGAANLGIVLVPPDHPMVPALRFLTGFCMAGVYPVGMKLASTWAAGDLGLLIGMLVAALTLGSASPNLIAALAGGLDWRLPCLGAAAGAFLAAGLIRFAPPGPRLAKAPPFQLANALQAWRVRPLRLANLGYLGHMWELYAMWAWIGAFLAASFAESGETWSPSLATFAVVAAGSLGALLGGWAADRFGRTTVTSLAMAVSGACAALIGLAFGGPPLLVLAIGLVWGVSVIADSAQFSASVAELSPPELVGTMLTVQTCLGFLLTLASIHLLPYLVAWVGWRLAFAGLAIGPFLGIWAMLRLRAAPEATRLAGGRR